jgi:hypothetical protein
VAWLKTHLPDQDSFAAVCDVLRSQGASLARGRETTAAVFGSAADRELIWNDDAHALLSVLVGMDEVSEASEPRIGDALTCLVPLRA